MKTIFVTGISTDVGKTIISAIVSQALKTDYWKPLQSGNLDELDSKLVESLWSNSQSKRFPENYLLTEPLSPHAAAEIDNITLKIENLILPKTENNLVIEGAGGILVPINSKQTIADLISKEFYIILVSKHYLGSINHTLLSLEFLKNKGFKKIGIVFNGSENKSTEKVIKDFFPEINYLGRIPTLKTIDKQTVKQQSDSILDDLMYFLK